MGLLNKIRSMSLKMKIISSIAIIAIIVSVVLFNVSRDACLVYTMSVLCIAGVANAWSTMYAYKPVAKNNHSLSGNAMKNGSVGLATADHNNSKTVTLQNDSRAEFQKKGKRLELQLTKNAESSYDNSELQAEKTFEIKTSTMPAGNQGTSGMICSDNAGGSRESLTVASDTLEVCDADSVTVWAQADFIQAIKDLGYDKDQDPSETPTPVPAGVLTEEDVTPPPAPVPLCG